MLVHYNSSYKTSLQSLSDVALQRKQLNTQKHLCNQKNETNATQHLDPEQIFTDHANIWPSLWESNLHLLHHASEDAK